MSAADVEFTVTITGTYQLGAGEAVVFPHFQIDSTVIGVDVAAVEAVVRLVLRAAQLRIARGGASSFENKGPVCDTPELVQ